MAKNSYLKNLRQVDHFKDWFIIHGYLLYLLMLLCFNRLLWHTWSSVTLVLFGAVNFCRVRWKKTVNFLLGKFWFRILRRLALIQALWWDCKGVSKVRFGLRWRHPCKNCVLLRLCCFLRHQLHSKRTFEVGLGLLLFLIILRLRSRGCCSLVNIEWIIRKHSFVLL